MQAPVASEIATLVHYLQIERGSSNGFLSSKGARFGEQKSKARAQADDATTTLKTRVDGLGKDETPFSAAVQKLLKEIEGIGQHRTNVDALAIESAANLKFYSNLIESALAAENELRLMAPTKEISDQLGVQGALSKGKEQAGKERALLTAVLTQKRFTMPQFRLAAELAAGQEQAWREVQQLSTGSLKESFEVLRRQTVWTAVDAVRESAHGAFAAELSGTEPEQWFNLSTQRIEELRKLEESSKILVEESVTRYLDVEKKAYHSILASAGGVLVVAILLVLWQAAAINRSLTGAVKDVVRDLTCQSEMVASAAREIDGASHSLASTTSQQAAALEETSATLEELTAQTKIYDESTRSAAFQISATRSAAERGEADVKRLNIAMLELQGASDNVARIVKTIDEIAFQTNLLALNAAVEAARAGEAGLGFAVVAEEVRALAQRSAEAAKETAQKIEASVASSRQGVALGKDLCANLEEIARGVREVDTLVSQISSASHEQTKGLEQISTAIHEIDRHTQDNASGSEETASAAALLDNQASLLRETVGCLVTRVGVKV